MTYFDASIDQAFRKWEREQADRDPMYAAPCPDCGDNADAGEHSMYVNRNYRGVIISWTCCLCGRTDQREP